MQTNKKKVPWILVAIGGVFCVWLGYLIGGAWRKGIRHQSLSIGLWMF